MKLPSFVLLLCFITVALAAQTPPATLTPEQRATSLADVEVQKCQDKIANVQRDVLNRYDDALQELQNSFQKSADLEGALAVRAERQRVAADNVLTEKNLVTEPKALRALQSQTAAKLHELVTQLIQESVPRLIELKKSLTIGGKLDEALAVRGAIEQLQNSFLPAARPEAGAILPAETLLQAYTADRPRADKQYKGQRITVRGVVGGFRQDPADAKFYLIYVTGGATSSAWVQCAFSTGEFRFREEKQFANTILVVSSKEDPAGVRVQKGQTIDIKGVCDGWDEVVKLNKCDFAR